MHIHVPTLTKNIGLLVSFSVKEEESQQLESGITGPRTTHTGELCRRRRTRRIPLLEETSIGPWRSRTSPPPSTPKPVNGADVRRKEKKETQEKTRQEEGSYTETLPQPGGLIAL